MIVGVTGHRPSGICGWTRWPVVRPALTDMTRTWCETRRPSALVSGMAQGWDIVCATVALDLGIPLIAILPYESFGDNWPAPAQAQLVDLCARAAEVHISTRGGYHPQAMQIRNMDVVNRSDELLALWSGAPGGTANALDYNRRMVAPRRVHNLWWCVDDIVKMR